MNVQVNSHYCNTAPIATVLEIAALIGMTVNQIKAAQKKGDAGLRSVVGTKVGNKIVADKVEFLEFDLKTVQPEPEAEPDIGKAGANNKKRGGGRSSNLTGSYRVVKEGLRANDDDPKWDIWNHIYAETTFEAVFKKAPAKVVKTGGKSIATPASELAWALKQGWIERVTA